MVTKFYLDILIFCDVKNKNLQNQNSCQMTVVKEPLQFLFLFLKEKGHVVWKTILRRPKYDDIKYF